MPTPLRGEGMPPAREPKPAGKWEERIGVGVGWVEERDPPNPRQFLVGLVKLDPPYA